MGRTEQAGRIFETEIKVSIQREGRNLSPWLRQLGLVSEDLREGKFLLAHSFPGFHSPSIKFVHR